MIKKILLVLVLLAVAAAAAIYFVGSAALNKGIKHGVETVGPDVTQTPVTLADVNISVLSGKGTLKGLNVGNPEGYKSENIFALGQIDIEVDTSTVFSDKIIINKIHIRQPEISYEKTFTSSNVKKLLDNIEQFTGPKGETSEDAPAEESGTQKQIVIKQLIIRGRGSHERNGEGLIYPPRLTGRLCEAWMSSRIQPAVESGQGVRIPVIISIRRPEVSRNELELSI